MSSTDAGTHPGTRGVDSTSANSNVAIMAILSILSSTDARSISITTCIECARTFDGERCFCGTNLNTRKGRIESLYNICSTISQHYGGIAQTGDARPLVAVAVYTDNGRIIQYHRGTVSDGNLHRMVRYIKGTRQHFAILSRVVGRQGREIHAPLRAFHRHRSVAISHKGESGFLGEVGGDHAVPQSLNSDGGLGAEDSPCRVGPVYEMVTGVIGGREGHVFQVVHCCAIAHRTHGILSIGNHGGNGELVKSEVGNILIRHIGGAWVISHFTIPLAENVAVVGRCRDS